MSFGRRDRCDLHLTRLASLAQISDRLAIMYLGRIVETGLTENITLSPKQPYTSLLLSAAPEKDPSVNRTRVTLEGEPPNPVDLPSGCMFAPRCPKAQEKCYDSEPGLGVTGDSEHSAACHFLVDEGVSLTPVDDTTGEEAFREI